MEEIKESIVEKLAVILRNVPAEKVDEVMALAKSISGPKKTREDSLVVDYSTPIRKQCKELGVKCYLDEEKITDIFYPARNGRLYVVEDGRATLCKNTAQYMREFKRQSRRGFTVKEGLALVRTNPEPLSELLRDHYIYLVGSRYDCLWTSDVSELPPHLSFDTGRVPLLSLYNGRPELISCPMDPLNVKWGATSCAIRKIQW